MPKIKILETQFYAQFNINEEIMLIIRMLFIAALSMSIVSFAATETNNSENNDQQQQTPKTDSSSENENNNSQSNQQPKADKKKESMADYCRKNPC